MNGITRSGYRVAEAVEVERVFSLSVPLLIGKTPDATARKLRMLASALADAADRVTGIDAESVAIERVGTELANVLAAHRSNDHA